MNTGKNICLSIIAAALSTAPCRAADNEDFNWTDAAQFVDSFPFPPRFVDSLAAAYGVKAPAPPLRTVPPQSFSKGEMLAYDIGWSFIKGGYVILTATPDPARHTLRLGAKALSRGFVTTFYRMRDYAISTVDADGLYPLFFEEHLREGKRYKADKWFLFDHAGKKLYTRKPPPSIPEFTNDYLSVLYMARTRRFAPGDTFMLPFYVDGKLYNLVFSCIKRETADFNGKKVSCLVVLPQPADDKGEFNKKKRLEIWFSDDEYKLPVRIKAKIAIGSIVADLIYAGRPKTAGTAGRTPALKPADTPKKKADSAKTRGTQKTADIQKDSTVTTARDTAVVANSQDTLPAGPDSITEPVETAAADDTAKPPALPVSKMFYETIEVRDAKPEPSREGCCGEPEPRPCSRDNSY